MSIPLRPARWTREDSDDFGYRRAFIALKSYTSLYVSIRFRIRCGDGNNESAWPRHRSRNTKRRRMVAVEPMGNVYDAETNAMIIRKFIKK